MTGPHIALGAFISRADDARIAPLGSGLIHQTYLAESARGAFVLQRFNDAVFQQPEQVMSNIAQIQNSPSVGTELGLRFRETSEEPNSLLWRSPDDGSCWRCSDFLANTDSYDDPPAPRFLEAAAVAFARFARCLEGLKLEGFHPTIPHFHHTPRRFEALQRAWSEADSSRRCRETYDRLLRLTEEGFPEFGLNGLHPSFVPWGIVHNDTKLNNCLFRKSEPKVVSVIDLDTVMPGSWLMDYGDLVRTSACTAAEDCPDLNSIGLDPDRFRAVSRGYLSIYGPRMSNEERGRMVYACFLMTLELSFRFFTDHLQGDRYFKTERPYHNLIRARAQAHLAQCFLQQRASLERALDELAHRKRSVPAGVAE